MHNLRRVFIALIALCLLPLAAVLLSALIAAVMGCELNEGVQQTCSLLGLDIGGVLSTMFVMGWFALMTIPLLVGILALWAILEGGVVWRKRRHDRKAAGGPNQGESA